MRKTSHKVLVGNPLYQCGLRILKFPKYLHDFMSQPNRPYGVYYAQTAVSPNAPPAPPDGETACLLAILNQCGATNVGLKADVKALFIHIGCLPLMGMVPAMWMRRAKRPELRIFTYGTHESVAPSRWGVREIYPIGKWPRLVSWTLLIKGYSRRRGDIHTKINLRESHWSEPAYPKNGQASSVGLLHPTSGGRRNCETVVWAT